MTKLAEKQTGRSTAVHLDSPIKVLFLNTRNSLGADVAVHLSLITNLDRTQVKVWAATGLYEAPGASTLAYLRSLPDLNLLPLELGRPLGQNLSGRLKSLALNGVGMINLARLAWLCRRNKIEIIHVTERPRDALFGLALARLGGGLCLIHAHTSYDRRNISCLSDWVFHHSDALIGVSHFTANTYRHQAGIPAGKVFAVHNAVDITNFRPDIAVEERLEMRKWLGICTEAPLVGCVARLSRWKDQETLLEALVELRIILPKVQLVLAGVNSDSAPDGQGTYQEYLMRRIKAFGLEDAVIFVGLLPYEEMPGFYSALDVLAHPAVEEPFGLAIVEALASARPVVAVAEGGIAEIIRDGVEGLLVSRKQPAAMAQAIASILKDEALARKLGKAGRERVLNTFTPDNQAAAVKEVYREILAHQR